MPLARHEMVSSSGIAYADFVADISGVSLEDTKLLPIFANLFIILIMSRRCLYYFSPTLRLNTVRGSNSNSMSPAFLLSPRVSNVVLRKTSNDCIGPPSNAFMDEL